MTKIKLKDMDRSTIVLKKDTKVDYEKMFLILDKIQYIYASDETLIADYSKIIRKRSKLP